MCRLVHRGMAVCKHENKLEFVCHTTLLAHIQQPQLIITLGAEASVAPQEPPEQSRRISSTNLQIDGQACIELATNERHQFFHHHAVGRELIHRHRHRQIHHGVREHNRTSQSGGAKSSFAHLGVAQQHNHDTEHEDPPTEARVFTCE